ncbi:MAG: ABC transporter substrate-binding protein [Candidatus Methylomirabilota bacterium]
MGKLLRSMVVLFVILAGWQAAWPAEKEKVDFGVGSAPGASVYIQVDLAKALGYFGEEGLDVNLQHFKGGAVAGAALVGGSIEISANAIDHVIKAKQQGKELRMIVSFTHLPGTPLVVNTKYRNEIKSPKDLRGRPVGVTAPGSATDLLMRYMLGKEGVRPEEMKIIGVGTNTMVPALENDQVVAAVGVDPWVTQLVKRGKGYLLVDLRTEKDTRAIFGGPYQFTGLLARADVIERRPGMIQKVVNALVKANRWMATNPIEKWAEVLPPELVGDKATWIESFKASKETFTADSLPTREAVMSVLRTFEAVGQIPNATKMDPDGLIDTRFVKKALERK